MPSAHGPIFVVSNSEKRSVRFFIGAKVSAHEPTFSPIFCLRQKIGPCALGIRLDSRYRESHLYNNDLLNFMIAICKYRHIGDYRKNNQNSLIIDYRHNNLHWYIQIYSF